MPDRASRRLIALHGFTQNQAATYGVGETAFALGMVAPPAIGGLEDGATYYIDVVDADTIRLLTAPTLDLMDALDRILSSRAETGVTVPGTGDLPWLPFP